MVPVTDHFLWDCPAAGFAWEEAEIVAPGTEGEGQLQRVLVERPDPTPTFRRYNPFTGHPALFRAFADLEPTEEAYAAFASRYGRLGIRTVVRRNGALVFGEPLAIWRAEHAELRAVSHVLAAIQSGDAELLKACFSIDDEGVRYARVDADPAIAPPARSTVRRDWLWDWAGRAESPDEAVLRLARGWVHEQINDALAGRRLDGEPMTSARLAFTASAGRMTIEVTPRSLLGALWLQCARVLTVNPTFRTCAHCGRLFEVAPGVRRRHARYCADRCKVAAHRARVSA